MKLAEETYFIKHLKLFHKNCSTAEEFINRKLKLPYRLKYQHLLSAVMLTICLIYINSNSDENIDIDPSELVPSVKTVSVEKKRLSHSIQLPGTITYKEKASITPKFTGRIESIKCDQGAHVKKGDLLATLETFELNIHLEQAKANVLSASANLKQAEARYGESRINTEKEIRNIEKIRSEIIEAKSALILSEKNLKNKKILYKMGGISKHELEKVYAEYLGSSSRFYQTKKQLQIASIGFRNRDIKSGSNPEKGSKNESLINSNTSIEKSGIDVAKASFRNALLELQTAQLYLKESKIISPIDGIIASRSAEIGEEVREGESIFTVVGNDQLYITARASESQLSYIKENQASSCTVDALDNMQIYGKVYQKSPIIDINSRSAEIKILISNPEGVLLPGMFARCSTVIREKENGIAVPKAALLENKSNLKESSSYVFVIRSNIAFKKTALPGDSYGDEIEIISGINPGDTVAYGNLQTLKDGSPVKINHEILEDKDETIFNVKGDE